MWWIIIGAVIALIVLIILMLLFTKQSDTLVGGISECEGKGGVCSSSTDPVCPSNTLQTSTFTCSGNNVCCIGIPKKCKDANDNTACGKDSSGAVISCKQFGKDFYCS